jgi:metal-responsive CopG/Arc/MetJ family transcriptional regulator
MATVKTAVSLEEPLLKQADKLAREMNVSRSRLFALAVEEFIERQQNQALLAALNTAYGEPDEAEEQPYRRERRHYHFRLVQEE